MDIYSLSRNFWDYSFENPENIKPNHIAMYFFAIEHCNRLGWKQKFGFPTTMVMDAISIKSYNTFIKTLNDLVDYGFIKMVEKSKNQYSSNIIALSKICKANDKALDKAIIKHSTKQSESTVQSIDSIDIPIHKETNLPIDNTTPTAFSMYRSLLDLGAEKQLINDWLKVRKTKKATNTKTALYGFISQVEKSNKDLNSILKICIENSWSGFKVSWLENLPKSESKIIPGETHEEKIRREYVERMTGKNKN